MRAAYAEGIMECDACTGSGGNLGLRECQEIGCSTYSCRECSCPCGKYCRQHHAACVSQVAVMVAAEDTGDTDHEEGNEDETGGQRESTDGPNRPKSEGKDEEGQAQQTEWVLVYVGLHQKIPCVRARVGGGCVCGVGVQWGTMGLRYWVKCA